MEEAEMVSSKGKATRVSETLILEDSRSSKNLMKGFKIYSGSERPRKFCGDPSRKHAGNAPMAIPRKSVPSDVSRIDLRSSKGKVQGVENTMGRCSSSVKVRIGRKALADVSNVNKVGAYRLRNRPSIDLKPMKDKVEGSNLKQGKSSIVKSPYVSRISLTKSVVVSNVSSRKPIGGKVQGIEKNMGKCDNSVKATTGRKPLAVVSNVNNDRSCQLTNRLSNNTKLLKERLEGIKLQHSKNYSTNGLYRKRISLNRSGTEANASSSKLIGPTGTIVQKTSKIKRTSTIRPAIITQKFAATNISKDKEVKPSTRSSSDDNSSAIHQKCGLENVQADVSSCSNDIVTAIISKPKSKRRRSYTLSLMARSELLGENADFVGKDGLPNIDEGTNPLDVVEYVDDIYQYYWTMEVLSPSLANYMVIQSEITPRTRGILINWLIEVHLKLELMQETLFLMVELLDRILSIVAIQKNDLQMVGLTALLLASKYEDFWHPKIGELISISSDSYTRKQMLDMEKLILKKLMYRLNVPTPYVFMLRFLKAAQSDRQLEDLAFYLIELCLVEYEALKFKPSLLCASAIYAARCNLHMIPAWTGLLRRHARYEESQLRICAEMILGFQRTAGLKPGNTTHQKFLSPERSCVAAIRSLVKLPPL